MLLELYSNCTDWAKPAHTFYKSQETHPQNVIQALQIMKVASTKTLKFTSLITDIFRSAFRFK